MTSETRIHSQGSVAACANCGQDFRIDPEDFQFYEKIRVPPPTWCRECRLIRRMQWRNERTFYKRNCALCGKDVIAVYSDPKETIYCRECWWSDKWDPISYGQEYDPNQNFLSQWRELFQKVPRFPVWHNRGAVNCDYANYIADSKNVYLSASGAGDEDISYCGSVDRSKDCNDCFFLVDSQLCYEIVDGRKDYNSSFLVNSENCVDCAFLFDCVGCQNCILSCNLRNKSYVFRNAQLSKEDYLKAVSEFDLGNFQDSEKLKQEFDIMRRSKALHKFANILRSPQSTGDYIEDSKNIKYSFGVYTAENISYSTRVLGTKDSFDSIGLGDGDLMYEVVSGGFNSSSKKFCYLAGAGNHDATYSALFYDCSHIFGCVGLRKKQYCILNKQYTKEEYEKLVPEIIRGMKEVPYLDAEGRKYFYGEFFPPEMSPFAYNETIAQEYFPLISDIATERGYRWKKPQVKNYGITKHPEDLPDKIKDADENFLKETIGCAHKGVCSHQCSTAFKIIPQEFRLYRRMNLPIPRLCPNCRHYERLARRNPMNFWRRKCMCGKTKNYKNTGNHFHGDRPCPNEFETSYAPERPEIVYCEQCYNAEIT